MKHFSTWLGLGLLTFVPLNRCAAEPNDSKIEFFENKVRPLLVEHCFSCHGEKKQQGGLRLDSQEAINKGGDTGPVVTSGDPAKSTLFKVVKYDGDIQMPPKGKLSDTSIKVFEEWVRQGAVFPGKSTKSIVNTDPKKLQEHWAFQPVRVIPPPLVKQPELVQNGIDSFVLKELEAKGRSFSAKAEKRTLIRRAYMTLLGLPPTREEIDQFENDQDAEAYAKLVDRLLASPQYGERWARIWLDYARYADTKGYVFQEDRNYPFAYTYRDWVIQALNQDLPYNEFITKQIAADRIPNAPKRDLAALGFLTLGRRFLNNTHDIIDDRIDVVTRTYLGLTVGCARCHDHKFDPIPTADYYSLYGIFASTREPGELPMLEEVSRTPEVIKFETELTEKQQAVNAFIDLRSNLILTNSKEAKSIANYLLVSIENLKKPLDQLQGLAREKDLVNLLMLRWRKLLQDQEKSPNQLFKLLLQFAGMQGKENIEAKLNASIATAPESLKQLILSKKPKTVHELSIIYAELIGNALKKPSKDFASIEKELQAIFIVEAKDRQQLFNRKDRDQMTALQRKVDAFRATAPAAPPRAMAVEDTPTPMDPVIFVRGNPGNRGAKVPRQFLQVIAGAERKPFSQGSGRLEMAQSIASASNPLTARVMMNRIWLNHFGQGLVRTPSDFGVRTENPFHADLLDWLAKSFVDSGWSIKSMHRLILTSRTFQQKSDVSEELQKFDPENQYLSRMNRRRVDLEQLRDSMLAVTDQLDNKMGGKSQELFGQSLITRRTVYGFIDRQNLPGIYRAFDLASPDGHTPIRFQTTVPQQSLYLLNSPLVVTLAKSVWNDPSLKSVTEPNTRIQLLYQRILSRNPTEKELKIARQFIDSPPAKETDEAGSAWSYGYGVLNETTRKIEFQKLPHWTGTAWQGGPQLPDPKTGWVTINSQGGHPGDSKFASILRWTAPRDLSVEVQLKLNHHAKEGDGVRLRLFTPSKGVLATSEVKTKSEEKTIPFVEMKKGESLDIIVDCKNDPNSDSYSSNVNIQSKADGSNWSSKRDFQGPAVVRESLNAWEELSQVLLLCNEFAFID
jgi:hypothetical protein